MNYEARKESIAQHEAPQWFKDAKLGIFIHWGLYSVPAFAPTEYGDIVDMISHHGMEFHFKNNAYAEWYLNSLRTGSKVYNDFHKKTYGENFKYEQFADIFKEESKKWNPNEWGELFKKAGAKYCVITTKHHDGFLLWPSENKNPQIKEYYSERDIVGELADAVRTEHLKFGTYYSGALDWSFNPIPIRETTSMGANPVATKDYAEYADKHFKELIDKYKTDILWNDIGYPKKGDRCKLISYYLNNVPDGTVNNRWGLFPKWLKILPKTFLLKKLINWIAKKVVKKGGLGETGSEPKIGDFLTPEYSPKYELSSVKFESCRGIGRSFGYNRMEKEEHYLTEKELIWSFIDIVSKNGNLLLNIGPKADGSIPEIQKTRLIQLGTWINRNKKGIYKTVPWKRAEGITNKGIEVRFTTLDKQQSKERNIFLFMSKIPEEGKVIIKNFNLEAEGMTHVEIMGKEKIPWKIEGDDTILDIPKINKEWISLGLCCK